MWLCKRDLSKECKGDYKDCTDCVLDKIRAEIEEYSLLTRERVIGIIDKYKAESEEENGFD